jgi:hypothetical protein
MNLERSKIFSDFIAYEVSYGELDQFGMLLIIVWMDLLKLTMKTNMNYFDLLWWNML